MKERKHNEFNESRLALGLLSVRGMNTQKIIDDFRYSVRCWHWDVVERYYEQYPGLVNRFNREMADLELRLA